jgi:hypothetical protein
VRLFQIEADRCLRRYLTGHGFNIWEKKTELNSYGFWAGDKLDNDMKFAVGGAKWAPSFFLNVSDKR